MKFKTGDKVKFLHDTGKGEISGIISKNQVMVRTSDGFDVPYLVSDLVKYQDFEDVKLQGGEEKNEELPKDTSRENPEIQTDNRIIEDEEVVFAVTPSEKGMELWAWLANSSSYNLYYTVSKNIDGEEHLLKKGLLEPDTKIRLSRLTAGRLDDIWKIRINIIFWNHSFYLPVNPLSKVLHLDFSALLKAENLSENDYFEGNAAIYLLHSFKKTEHKEFDNKSVPLKDLAEAIKSKTDVGAVKVPQKQKTTEEVDLHIDQIVDDYKGLSNGEILNLQMSRFKTALDTAIIHKNRRIVFIHGVGNGKLKHELRRSLDRNYPKLKYQDASFKEYGYGATLVIVGGGK